MMMHVSHMFIRGTDGKVKDKDYREQGLAVILPFVEQDDYKKSGINPTGHTASIFDLRRPMFPGSLFGKQMTKWLMYSLVREYASQAELLDTGALMTKIEKSGNIDTSRFHVTKDGEDVKFDFTRVGKRPLYMSESEEVKGINDKSLHTGIYYTIPIKGTKVAVNPSEMPKEEDPFAKADETLNGLTEDMKNMST